MESVYDRTSLVIGKSNVEKIKKANVCIFGVGGVGSYALEALARIGVGKLTIIDKDEIDITNVNRQLIATVDNVGKPKVEQAEKRIKSINPEIQVIAIKDNIDSSNIDKYITAEYDYVIDAIDSVDSKIAIIQACKQKSIKVISSMGMANRLDPLKLKVSDISKTEMCPLAKVVRKKLKENGIQKVKVVFSTEPPIKLQNNQLGSVSYVPAAAGLVIASEVIKDIIS